MDSSEHDDAQDYPSSAAELDTTEMDAPQAGEEVSPIDYRLTEAEEPVLPPEPLEPAEPGIYWCEADYSGIHPVLQGTIHQGENDLTTMTNIDHLLAVAALVRDGVLRKMK